MNRTSTYQIQQWEQENPHDVHEMPVEAEVLHHRVMIRRVSAMMRPVYQKQQYTGADNHVGRVHAGHRKIQSEKDGCLSRYVGRSQRLMVFCPLEVKIEIRSGNMVFDVLVVVLPAFDAKKDSA